MEELSLSFKLKAEHNGLLRVTVVLHAEIAETRLSTDWRQITNDLEPASVVDVFQLKDLMRNWFHASLSTMYYEFPLCWGRPYRRRPSRPCLFEPQPCNCQASPQSRYHNPLFIRFCSHADLGHYGAWAGSTGGYAGTIKVISDHHALPGSSAP